MSVPGNDLENQLLQANNAGDSPCTPHWRICKALGVSSWIRCLIGEDLSDPDVEPDVGEDGSPLALQSSVDELEKLETLRGQVNDRLMGVDQRGEGIYAVFTAQTAFALTFAGAMLYVQNKKVSCWWVAAFTLGAIISFMWAFFSALISACTKLRRLDIPMRTLDSEKRVLAMRALAIRSVEDTRIHGSGASTGANPPGQNPNVDSTSANPPGQNPNVASTSANPTGTNPSGDIVNASAPNADALVPNVPALHPLIRSTEVRRRATIIIEGRNASALYKQRCQLFWACVTCLLFHGFSLYYIFYCVLRDPKALGCQRPWDKST